MRLYHIITSLWRWFSKFERFINGIYIYIYIYIYTSSEYVFSYFYIYTHTYIHTLYTYIYTYKFLCHIFSMYLTNFSTFFFTLNIRLSTISAWECRQWCFAWFLGEFQVFQHHTPLTKQTLSEMISLWYALQFMQYRKKRKKIRLAFIYLVDYRPLIRVSDWLLQTISQIHGSVYFSDLRGP